MSMFFTLSMTMSVIWKNVPRNRIRIFCSSPMPAQSTDSGISATTGM